MVHPSLRVRPIIHHLALALSFFIWPLDGAGELQAEATRAVVEEDAAERG